MSTAEAAPSTPSFAPFGEAPAPVQADIAAAKQAQRRASLARRAQVRGRAGADAADRLADHWLSACVPAPGATVSGFWPMGDEIDVRPLLRALVARGHACALPVVVARGLPLQFRRWVPGDTLRPAPFGLSEPGPEATEVVPDWLLVPLLAFTRGGDRLGYGGGFYDRTLAGLRAVRPVVAVGVAYAGQETDRVPVEPHDQRLDWIVTEVGAWRVA